MRLAKCKKIMACLQWYLAILFYVALAAVEGNVLDVETRFIATGLESAVLCVDVPLTL